MIFDGFDWDIGNKSKVRKHGLSEEQIEWIFHQEIWITPDIKHSTAEDRFVAIGRSSEGRYVLIGFTIRFAGERKLIRPITARYMHEKEIKTYEQKRK
jgi:uncharacterized protein